MIELTDNPSLADVKFRYYRGEEDFPKMLLLMIASSDADGRKYTGATVDEIARQYAHLNNCNPLEDAILAEVEGSVVAYSRCYWEQELCNESPDLYLYRCTVHVLPEWRKKRLGEAIFQKAEQRLREIAATHPDEHPKFFEAGAYNTEHYWTGLFEKAGYEPVRYFQEMQRPSLENIPDFPLVKGLETRPALAEHYRLIWESDHEAFQDHWGYMLPTEADYQEWLSDKESFQPRLWQVAWNVDTGEIAGQVRTYISEKWNKKYDCKLGYIDNVSVRKPWRRQGIARALLTRSLHQLKAEGMTSAELNVDSDNLSGATRLYEDCGFCVVKSSTLYRKPL